MRDCWPCRDSDVEETGTKSLRKELWFNTPARRAFLNITPEEVVVAITNGQLDLGPWEQIFYGEFDGRRRKRVLVKIIGE